MSDSVHIERLHTYTPEDAAAIGKLLPALSERFTDSPIAENLLREIIESPHHEQIVARNDDGKVIGTATLSITIGTGAGHKAYLEDFVVDPNTQGQGIGGVIWDEIIKWCTERNVSLFFTSRASKEAAQHFYLKRGATIRDTNVFQWKPEN